MIVALTGPILSALILAGLFFEAFFGLGPTGRTFAATAVWAPPAILLPYVGDNPSLCVNPLDSTISYLAGSGGYGMAVGSEGNNWLNGTFTKLSDQKGSGDCAYDEFGTLHAIWSLRNEAGNYNIFYNSVQKGSGNVPLYRNLSQEIYGQDKYTIKTDIAVSIPQHKVFITYQERREGGDALMFIESANQGGTWSKPVQLGILSGYRPAEPDIIVDKAGIPHVFYGVFNEGSPSIINHRMRLADGTWTAPENITGNNLSRPIWTQAELDPTTGDIYVSWLEGQAGISRWNAATGKWTSQENVTNAGGRAAFPTIAVNSQTGTVWMIWQDGQILWTRQSTDHGQTWQGRELAVDLGAAKIGRMYGLKALSTRGIIYLLISGDQLEPLYYVGPTLFLMTFNQSVSSQPTPTTTPGATGTPPGTSTPVIQPTLSPAPPTPGPTATATPAITMAAPTITPQPTVTPQPTATPAPTVTPQPTTTPQTFPTAAPTQAPAATATLQPTITPVPTATARPVPPTATSQPIPAQVQPPKPQAQTVEPTLMVTNTPIPVPNTATSAPAPTGTIAPEAAEATALAEAQKQAASTPQSLIVPLAPVGSGGRGPALVLPTSTPLPTILTDPTSTPEPTATPKPVTPTASADISLTATAMAIATVSVEGKENNAVQEPAPTRPPDPGAFWLLPVGLVVAGKGVLNLLALLLKP